jgi:hypothetical protein
MRWEWDSDGDDRVAGLWHLREVLSRSREVVYVKWFQGRATFFSFEVFENMLAYLGAHAFAGGEVEGGAKPKGKRGREVVASDGIAEIGRAYDAEELAALRELSADRGAAVTERMGANSRNVLEVLLNDSPLSTKQLKASVELEGKLNEPAYNRAMKPLWNRCLLVGFGEFEDSSFPSLGIGATAALFEEQWRASAKISPAKAEEYLRAKLGEKNPFWKFVQRVKKNG